ncbi:TIM barrel protein [Roseovarius sp. LXJ103]|uniref:hydroxypyruvate isomerase family protein n=1 Tax=Roseovarius carneus TaxID=2853164 RepID=UPI000D605CC7|nr:TIM barrel protein [Roseovarius carneus]MBZ8117616.1 TIM barrel protein [Roseovarius carneus]PWE36597.1 hydroxypyruvate isomerase [Pelagicola sp. LXJ1103]
MPRFCANLSMLFQELPLLERFAAAAHAGFEAVEVLFPYDDPTPLIQRALISSGLPLALINTPPPNWTGGNRGFAAVPGSEDRFRHDFKRTLRYADVLRPRFIHIMAGAASGTDALDAFTNNLTWAAAEAPNQRLTIEPINTDDMPGYFLNDYTQAAEILDRVAAPNLHMQFDAYHAHKITGDMLTTWRTHAHRIAHIQIASPNGRHEPDRSPVDYPNFFNTLDDSGYADFVSAEYIPRTTTTEGLGWMI